MPDMYRYKAAETIHFYNSAFSNKVLLNQIITRGSSYFECFDSHSEVVLFPHSHVHLSILASSQLVLHGDVCALHLPLVMDG